MSKKSIHDFIYLDIERVRSSLAQLTEGLTSERINSSEKQAEAMAQAEGGIPILGKAKGEMDFRYVRSSSETKSLHDYIFHELVNGMKKEKLLTDITNHKFAWEEKSFRDGMFVLAQGIIRVIDYKSVVETLGNLPNLAKVLDKISSTGNRKGSTQNFSEVKKLPIREIASFVNDMYGDLVRVRIFPSADNLYQNFVGSADKALFRYSPTILAGLYGKVIDADWKCLVQINKGSSAFEMPAPKTGSGIEDQLEFMADHLASLTELTQGISFPSVAVTPIAIYREIL